MQRLTEETDSEAVMQRTGRGLGTRLIFIRDGGLLTWLKNKRVWIKMFGIWIANINLVNFMDTDLKYICQR